MHVKENMTIPSVAEVQALMRHERDLFPPSVDLLRLESYVHDSYDKMAMVRSVLASEYPEVADKVKSTLDGTMASTIVAHLGLSKYLKTTEAGAISYNEESLLGILAYPHLSDSVKETIKLVSVYQKAFVRKNSMVSLRNSYITDKSKYIRADHIVSDTGSALMFCTGLEYTEQYTGRITPATPALGNVDRECKDIYAVPDTHEFYSVDLGQTDPKHLYHGLYRDPLLNHCINMYGDAYYGALHYCEYVPSSYFRRVPVKDCIEKSHAELIDMWLARKDFSEIVPMEITKELKARRQGLKTEVNGVNYGKGHPENAANEQIFLAMVERLQKHPIKIKLMAEIETKLKAGSTRFKTLVGNEFDITKSPKYNDYRGNISSLSRLVIAGMIQGTTAACNRLLLKHCRDELDALFTRIPMILNVHDSISFALPKNLPYIDDFKAFIRDELMCITMDIWGPGCKIAADVEEKENKSVPRPAFIR